MDTFCRIRLLLFVYRIFGLFMPSNDADGSEPWLFVLALAGWGLLALIHMIVLPIWMLIASLRYWEVNRRMLAVTGLLFSVLAPACMVLMLSFWSVSG